MGTLFIVSPGNGTSSPTAARELGQLAAKYGDQTIEVCIVGTKSSTFVGDFLAGYGGAGYARFTYYATPEIVCRALLEGLRSDHPSKPAANWGLGCLYSLHDIASQLRGAGTSSKSILAFLAPGDMPPVLDHLRTLRRDRPTEPLDPTNVTVVHFDGNAIWCEQPRTTAPTAAPAA